MRDQPKFFYVDDRLKRLSDLGDQLEGFRAAVDFEMFCPDLDAALAYSDGAQGGRPPFDPMMTSKVLVIQTTNNLSDERSEFLINDRLSFMRFLGLGSRRALDGYVHQGQAAQGWLEAASRGVVSQEAEGPLHAGGSLAGEQRQIKSQIEGRTYLRRGEGPDGLVHPHRRDCAEGKIGLANLVYNIKRSPFLRRIAVV